MSILENHRNIDSDEPDQQRKQLLAKNKELINQLIQLVGTDGGFDEKQKIREIGQTLHEQGGFDLMQDAYMAVRSSGRYFSQDIWHMVGKWRQ